MMAKDWKARPGSAFKVARQLCSLNAELGFEPVPVYHTELLQASEHTDAPAPLVAGSRGTPSVVDAPLRLD